MNVVCLRHLRHPRRLPVSASLRLQHSLVATTPVMSQNFLEQLLENHKSSQEGLLRQQESLQRRLEKANAKLVQRSDAAGEQKVKFRELELSSLAEIAKLNTEIKLIQNNLDLRTSMEIVAEVLRVRAKNLPTPITLPAIGVQPVLDAIVGGRFDTSLIHFNDAKKRLMNEVGGVTSTSVKKALDKLYGELSKHHHDSGSTTHLTVRAGEQTPPEAIAALSVLLFARRLFHLSIDTEYHWQDSGGQRVLLLSKL